MINNVSHKKTWNAGVTQVQVEPPLTPLIKIKHDGKSDKDFIKPKLRRYPTSKNSDLYEFKMAVFENGKREEFLMLFCNFNMTLASSGKLVMDAKFKYICMLSHR